MATVRINELEFLRVARLLESIAGGIELAGKLAINDTLRAVRTSAVRKITKLVAIKSGNVRDKIKLKRATPKDLTGEVHITKEHHYRLFAFGAKQRKRGVSYRIERAGTRKLIPGAWVDPARRQVFVRSFAEQGDQEESFGETAVAGEKGLGIRKRVGRTPIRQVFGPYLGDLFERVTTETLAAEAAEKLEERLEAHVARLLRKAGL